MWSIAVHVHFPVRLQWRLYSCTNRWSERELELEARSGTDCVSDRASSSHHKFNQWWIYLVLSPNQTHFQECTHHTQAQVKVSRFPFDGLLGVLPAASGLKMAGEATWTYLIDTLAIVYFTICRSKSVKELAVAGAPMNSRVSFPGTTYFRHCSPSSLWHACNQGWCALPWGSHRVSTF